MLNLKKLKAFSASLLVVAFVVGCAGKQTDTLDPILDETEAFSEDQEGYPISVSFNNTYKGLVTENEPVAKADPRAAAKYFIKLINSSKKTLDGAFYDIGDPDVVKAFVAAKKRGVNVRIVTDNEGLMDKNDPTKPRQTIADLRAGGITVKDDARQKLMHQKFMVVDNTYVWTGSMNLTTSSMYHHNNNSIQLKSPELAQNFNAEFSRYWDQNMYGPNAHTIPNPVVNIGSTPIRTFFSPSGGTAAAINEELKKAKKSIRFMAFSMTHKDMLATMIEKKNLGLSVEGVFDECLIPQYSIYFALKKAGIQAWGDGNQALMHHKVMVIDEETVITGSFNFSKSAEEGNNENTLIIKSPSIAKVYLGEYSRVKNAHFKNKNLPAYDHPACGKRTPSNTGTEPTPVKNSAVGVEPNNWENLIKE